MKFYQKCLKMIRTEVIFNRVHLLNIKYLLKEDLYSKISSHSHRISWSKRPSLALLLVSRNVNPAVPGYFIFVTNGL